MGISSEPVSKPNELVIALLLIVVAIVVFCGFSANFTGQNALTNENVVAEITADIDTDPNDGVTPEVVILERQSLSRHPNSGIFKVKVDGATYFYLCTGTINEPLICAPYSDQ